MAAGTAESLAKTMGLWPAPASPVFACLHTKQITVVICVGEKGEGENHVSKFEQISVLRVLLLWWGVKYKACR